MKKRSFLSRLTGGLRLPETNEEEHEVGSTFSYNSISKEKQFSPKVEYDDEIDPDNPEDDGELTVDMYQTPSEIIIQTMAAGVRPEDLQINITRDAITIRGKRETSKMIDDEDYFLRELYWGTFSRTLSLPQEVEPDKAEAIERNGLLIIKIPKIDKGKQAMIKVKSL